MYKVYETSDFTQNEVKMKVTSWSSKSDLVQEVIRRRMIRKARNRTFSSKRYWLSIDWCFSSVHSLILKRGWIEGLILSILIFNFQSILAWNKANSKMTSKDKGSRCFPRWHQRDFLTQHKGSNRKEVSRHIFMWFWSISLQVSPFRYLDKTL